MAESRFVCTYQDDHELGHLSLNLEHIKKFLRVVIWRLRVRFYIHAAPKYTTIDQSEIILIKFPLWLYVATYFNTGLFFAIFLDSN